MATSVVPVAAVATVLEAGAIAITYLQWLRPGGPWGVTAIVPDGPATTITTENEKEAADFIETWNGRRNLYYSVNPPRGATRKKARKADIATIEFLLADLDPIDGEAPEQAKERYTKALENQPEASALIDSGNGIQALWRLETPIALAPPVDGKLSLEDERTIADVEARSKALMERLGAKAGTQNVDRLLRLPGTINLPNKKKRGAGRVPCEARLLRANGAIHPLDAFPPPEAAAKAQAGRQQSKSWSLDALPISDRIRNLIRGIDDPEYPYPSRSERVMAVLVAMAEAGCLDEDMRAVIRDYPIGDHVREQSDPEKYLDRQIARARQMAIDPHVAKLNEKYALVIVGDKTAVLTTGAKGIKFLTISAFEQWLANRFIRRGNKRVSLAKYWLSHPQRQQYEGVVFAPGRVVASHYNLWKGFAAEPRPGDCSKFLAHVRDNVCRGNENLYHWVIGWFAQIFQHPDKKIGTSLVLRGPQGVGKTKVGEVIGSLLGEHYKLVSDPRYITGRFNSHLADCLLLHADEAFWAGDHAAEGKLKDLITGHDHFIEYKGKEPWWHVDWP